MKHEIYIKGCYDRFDNAMSFAFVIVEDGIVTERRAAKYTDEINTASGVISVLPNKGQYQAELCAVAYALFVIKDKSSDVTIYTNNQNIGVWLNKIECPDDYEELMSVCKRYSVGRQVKAEWIPKASDNVWNMFVNVTAEGLLGMQSQRISKIY